MSRASSPRDRAVVGAELLVRMYAGLCESRARPQKERGGEPDLVGSPFGVPAEALCSRAAAGLAATLGREGKRGLPAHVQIPRDRIDAYVETSLPMFIISVAGEERSLSQARDSKELAGPYPVFRVEGRATGRLLFVCGHVRR
jgi:hypothetical protein